MSILNFVFPPWARVVVMVALFCAGWWTRGSVEARFKVHELKTEVRQANKVDVAVAGKLHDEAKGDGQRAVLNQKHDEAARHDPTYREYLDRQLPAAAVQFLRDAERIPYGPDGADPGSEAGRHD